MQLEEQLQRGNVLLLPVDINTADERGNETYLKLNTHPVKVRPAIVWRANGDGDAWLVDVVPLTSTPSRVHRSVAVDGLPGINNASTYTMDRIVRLHPSLTVAVLVVGRVRQGILDALEALVGEAEIDDLSDVTGLHPPTLHTDAPWAHPASRERPKRHSGRTVRRHRRTRRGDVDDLPRPTRILSADEAFRAARHLRAT